MKLNYLLSDIKNQVLSVNPSVALKIDSNSSKSKISKIRRNSNYLDIDIKGLALNSKLVKNGDLFFCLSGTRHKGSDFINEAYLKGTRAVMVDEEIKSRLSKNLIIIRVKDTIRCLGLIVDKFYGHALDKLNTIAVTGTNGKTTTTFIIENILKTFKKQVGVIGTINYRFGRRVFIAKNTTPDILTTHNVINRMLRNKIQYVLIEVSSHALSQRRIEGLKFDQVIFTNLSQDHFDYHKTKRNYFVAKSKLFTNYLKENGVAIINVDDTYGLKLLNLIKKNNKHRILTYGIKKKADVNANNILFKRNGCSFTAQGIKHKFRLNTNLIGLFNIYNALASIGACLALDIPVEYIKKGLEEIYVPGRLELISRNHNIRIFVDYAHTEDALRNILLSLEKSKGSGRLIVVFGCGGDRDKDKRHKMGRIANELADFIIITSDNPRFEDPKKIISDIKAGIRNTSYMTLVDRKQAIEKAIDIARGGDIIVVAGKGHEDYQIVKDKKIVFNDRSVIEDILSKKGFAGCLN
ncbi:MAG: UDP-N-acetylmuramoyl-L-alanyl-D-glutamate--2,6-diaminopimelate ligase [Candidatus Omnitrophica bacterium]|nr:UDP-N-acetylmuramoyl-L-alanyl-D-glutamate--2,6-diaminopimelate ligase [Candidatus Omnitrophota bacterium]